MQKLWKIVLALGVVLLVLGTYLQLTQTSREKLYSAKQMCSAMVEELPANVRDNFKPKCTEERSAIEVMDLFSDSSSPDKDIFFKAYTKQTQRYQIMTLASWASLAFGTVLTAVGLIGVSLRRK